MGFDYILFNRFVSTMEPKRLWQKVTAALRVNDQETATNEKCKLEEQQREDARQREETKVFTFINTLLLLFFSLKTKKKKI